MRLPAALGLLCFLVSATLATAQVQVSAQTDGERANFLLYERLDLLVTVTNTSESDLVLDNEEGHPWLSFLVSKHDRLPVRAERQALFKPLTLKVGESKTLRVNLTPLFSFREEGNYTAAAVIDLPGAGDIASPDVPFTVLRGRRIWSVQRPVDGGERTYSLIRFSPKPDETELYLRVEEPAENVVYANVGLGGIEAFVDPQVYFDPEGNIHILHLLAMSTYLYSRADAQGKILHQAVFKTFQQIPPRLSKMDDGNVYVAGGMEETPDNVRESLSDGQKGHSADNSSSAPAAAREGLSAAHPDPLPDAASAVSLPASAPAPAMGTEAASH
jgi:hypothetical protein